MEERVQGYGGAAQDSRELDAGGSTLLYCDVKVGSEGEIFDCW